MSVCRKELHWSVVTLALALLLPGCFERKVDRSGLLCEPGLSAPCYTGLPVTRGVGTCRAGTLLCWEESGTAHQACEWQVLPTGEECNGLDDDCDGAIDDDGACHVAALAELERDIGPVQAIPAEEQGRPQLLAGPCWTPLYPCPPSLPVGLCIDDLLDRVGPVVGLEPGANERGFSHQVSFADGLGLVVYRQYFHGVEVEGGGVTVQMQDRDVYALHSTVQPVRRNLPVTPLVAPDSIPDLLPPGVEVLDQRLVLTARVRGAAEVPEWLAVADGDADVFSTSQPDADILQEPAPLPTPEEDQWLAYRVDYLVEGVDSRRCYIDARTGTRHLDIPRNLPLSYYTEASGSSSAFDPSTLGSDGQSLLESGEDFLAFTSQVTVLLNGAEVSLADGHFGGTVADARIHLRSEAHAHIDSVELVGAPDALPPCDNACGWYPMGSQDVFLCDEGGAPPCGALALPHELSHLLFQPFWDVDTETEAPLAINHALVDFHALLALAWAQGQTASGFQWLAPGHDFEPGLLGTCRGAQCASQQDKPGSVGERFGRALVETMRRWDEAGFPDPLLHAQRLLYTFLWSQPRTTLAIGPEEAAYRFTALCMGFAAKGTWGFTEASCLTLQLAFERHGVADHCQGPVCTEYCNGTDDNCDAAVDNCVGFCLAPEEESEDYTLREVFYHAAEETRGVGICREGLKRCAPTGWVTEVKEILPVPCAGSEAMCNLCDGADNNCDGVIDETCPCHPDEFEPRMCGGQKGEEPWCKAGIQVCEPTDSNPEGGILLCQGPPLNLEICDGVDNDCDGVVDDDPHGMGEQCTADATGACMVGSVACESGQVICLPGIAQANDGCFNEDLNCDGILHADWEDVDHDGYYAPPGYECPDVVALTFDCDDNDPMIHPGAMVPCGYKGNSDNDCDGADDKETGHCICMPECSGKNCGDDGCGGTCGSCGPGEVCEAGLCTCSEPCGGKVCGFDLCGNHCGMGFCDYGYACIEGQCHEAAGTCLLQCGGTTPDGVVCPNVCPPGFECAGGVCKCAPQCAGKACGPNMCGGSCGGCPAGKSCNEFFQCVDD